MMERSIGPVPPVSRRRALFVRGALFGLPLLYLALLFAVQPADHMGAPDAAPWAHQLLYDDVDVTDMALRGLNAHLGRTAGRPADPPEIDREEYARQLNEERPLEPRYYLEYPHAALLLFRLAYLVVPAPEAAPAAVTDGSFRNIAFHQPRDERQRELWHRFRLAARTYSCLMCVCLFGLILTLRAGYLANGGLAASGALLLMPAALYYAVNRFDVLPTLLTALGLACLGRRRLAASAVFLGAATMIKVYPALLAPLFVRYLWPDRRAGEPLVPRAVWVWLAAYTATCLAVFVPPLVVSGWESVWAPYRFQLTRGQEPLASYGFIPFLSDAAKKSVARVLRLGSLVLLLALLLWRPLPDLASLLRRSAVVLIAFLWLSVFYSPQWILWLTPFLLPLAARSRGLTALVVALDLVTFISFPFVYGTWELMDFYSLWNIVMSARTAVLAALAIVLLRGPESLNPSRDQS